MERIPLPIDSRLGSVTVSADAVAGIAARTAVECYGVVDLSARGRVGRLLGRDPGVAVSASDGGIRLDVYVVVEYGLNLTEVANTVRNRVSYEVERVTGLTVTGVEVHIRDARRSA